MLVLIQKFSLKVTFLIIHGQQSRGCRASAHHFTTEVVFLYRVKYFRSFFLGFPSFFQSLKSSLPNSRVTQPLWCLIEYFREKQKNLIKKRGRPPLLMRMGTFMSSDICSHVRDKRYKLKVDVRLDGNYEVGYNFATLVLLRFLKMP